jgi:hypothetical protein
MPVVWISYVPAAVFIAITTALLLLPILSDLKVGWKYKRQGIINSFSDSAKREYIPSRLPAGAANAYRSSPSIGHDKILAAWSRPI